MECLVPLHRLYGALDDVRMIVEAEIRAANEVSHLSLLTRRGQQDGAIPIWVRVKRHNSFLLGRSKILIGGNDHAECIAVGSRHSRSGGRMMIIAHGNIRIVRCGAATQQKMDICCSTSHLIGDAMLFYCRGMGLRTTIVSVILSEGSVTPIFRK